jgi:dipicolinate synthase subunit A
MKAAIIGGDRRMLYAAKAFCDSGAEVMIAGFGDSGTQWQLRTTDIRTAAAWADFSVLPVRPVSDGVLSCPLSEEKVTVRQLAEQIGGKPVFCGNSASLEGFMNTDLYDYAAREDFAVKNAVLTAEGAIEILLRESEDSLCAAEVLILGCGRIGKVLAHHMKALGAKVTVAARKPSDRALTEASGCKAVDYSLKELYRYRMIINTVPAPVLSGENIDRLHRDAIVTDLASAPGGVDFDRARDRGLKCIHALGLPGKTAPKAAGRIIKETITQMIKEENGGKDNSGLCDDRLLLHL